MRNEPPREPPRPATAPRCDTDVRLHQEAHDPGRTGWRPAKTAMLAPGDNRLANAEPPRPAQGR